MFETHNPRIRAFAQTSAEALAHVGLFVLATIQNPIERAAEDAARIARGEAEPRTLSRSFFGFKLRAAYALMREREALFDDAMTIGASDPLALTLRFSRLEGFALVKAGFFAQLAFGVSGCLDSHNLARFGLDVRAFRIRPPSEKTGARAERTRAKRCAKYLSTIERCGGTAALWDSWCEYVASLRGDSAENVSALHVEAMGIE